MNNLSGLENCLVVLPKLILGKYPRDTFKNAAHWSLISQVFCTTINSEEFFRVLVYLAGSEEFLPKLNPKLCSFKDRCIELRGLCVPSSKNFPGVMFGDALINGEKIELFSFDEGISSLKLKENEKFKSIFIPEDKQGELATYSRPSPFVARSEKYLAICNRSDTYVYIFNPDTQECLDKFETPEGLSQIAIQDNRLYLVLDWGVTSQIQMFDLDSPEEDFYVYNAFGSQLPRNICFGKEYFTYSISMDGEIKTIVESLSYFKTGERLDHASVETQGECYLFSAEDAFIEVIFKDLYICDIKEISFKDGQVQTKVIKEGLVLSKGVLGKRTDVCFSDNRLVFAYAISFETKFFAYDFISEETVKLTSIPRIVCHHRFKPRFLCLEEKIHYLYMDHVSQDEYKSNLTTFTFSKL